MKGKNEQKGRVNRSKYPIGRGVLFISIVLILALAVFAVSETITTFTTNNPKENITFTQEESKGLYVDIPLYAYVTNFEINVTGLNAT